MAQPNNIVVIIPTYNESESITTTLDSLIKIGVNILVVDDNSPDGTAQIVEKYTLQNERIKLLHGRTKSGLGTAYRAGFQEVTLASVSHVVQMDADGSHRIEDLQNLLSYLYANPETDLIIGSRWVPGGKTYGWSTRRLWLSRSANRFSRFLLHSRVHDLTSGFKVLSRNSIEFLLHERLEARGYGFQIESTLVLERSGFQISEVPITFIEREFGKSKMTFDIIFEALGLIIRIFLRRKNVFRT